PKVSWLYMRMRAWPSRRIVQAPQPFATKAAAPHRPIQVNQYGTRASQLEPPIQAARPGHPSLFAQQLLKAGLRSGQPLEHDVLVLQREFFFFPSPRDSGERVPRSGG